jgi:predicted amidohydrolase YtcJ
MKTRILAIAIVLSILGITRVPAQAPADLILTNGTIVTVDERFTIAQAVAIRGDRFIAVGSDQAIGTLAGPSTRRIDLRGKAVIPGLIDNHMHLLRAGTTWQYEVRWDGIASRAEALERLRARAKTVAAGEWIYTLGGWTIEQFADDSRPFTRAELDRVVPDHPLLLQASYYKTYLNSRALQTLGIDNATGVIDEAGVRAVAARLPVASGDRLEASTRLMISDLNKAGLTSFGSAGCETDVLPVYRTLADQGQLNVRVFCITGAAAANPQQVDRVVAQVPTMKLFQGDRFIDHVFYGESVYGPLHDPMFVPTTNPQPDELAQWRRIATEIAKAGLPLHVHANMTNTIDAFLTQVELVHKEHPIRNLRWTLAHVNQINGSQLERMKALGMYAAVHPWAVINGGINRTVFGEAAIDMPPLRTIQESGITWGLGSDGTRANQILPFTTLWWAVTGKMVGGRVVVRPEQTISREDALIAHTRRNAFFVFRENDLGSIQAGKLADLLVLDRDYLTIPADQIKDIKPVMTIVGGRIVFGS